MATSSSIPGYLIDGLLELIEGKIEGYTWVAQNFLIQYTYFEFINNQWVMKNFLDIGNESVKNIYLKISPRDATNITVFGKNPKYSILQIKRKLDMRNKSKFNKIYACDLYKDFEPEHYEGKCYTSPYI